MKKLLIPAALLVTLILAGCTQSPKTASSPADLAQYDGKIITVASADGKLTGQIGLTVVTSSGKANLKANYNLLINEALPKNKTAAHGFDYQYIGDLVQAGDPTRSDGAVTPIFCNKEISTTDPFSVSYSHNNDCSDLSTGAQTSTFAWQFSRNYASYEELIAATQVDIYSGADAWEQDPADPSTSTLNGDKALSQGNKAASFTVTYTQ